MPKNGTVVARGHLDIDRTVFARRVALKATRNADSGQFRSAPRAVSSLVPVPFRRSVPKVTSN